MKIKPFFYHQNEGAGPWWRSASWRLGERFKGHWCFGSHNGLYTYLALIFALGGEDNMLQMSVTIPWVGHWAIGVRVPRWATKSWVYERREWGVRLGWVGARLELFLGFDEMAADMRDHHLRLLAHPRCRNCRHDEDWHNNPNGCTTHAEREGLTDAHCGCTAFEPEEFFWSRLSIWPGWKPQLLIRGGWLLGRTYVHKHHYEPVEVLVPMPEGLYPAEVTKVEREWRRKRWPWPTHKRTDFEIKLLVGIPFPGKGESSYDCDDDALFGTGGRSTSDAIANAVRGALDRRERYGGRRGLESWEPREGWPEKMVAR